MSILEFPEPEGHNSRERWFGIPKPIKKEKPNKKSRVAWISITKEDLKELNLSNSIEIPLGESMLIHSVKINPDDYDKVIAECEARQKKEKEARTFILQHAEFFERMRNHNGSYPKQAYEWCYVYFDMLQKKEKE